MKSDITTYNTDLCVIKHKNKILQYKTLKRFTDLIIATIAIIILSPLLVVLGILIKIDSRGPIIFKQIRTGKNGRKFKLYKFRSMVTDNDVHDFSQKDQPTKVGRFIRKTSLDELPQLLNIIKGDMSFIGPRPWIPDYYENMNETQKHRCDVRPGITGSAQVNGRNNINIFEKISYDIEYVKNLSLKEDIRIIIQTAKIVLSKEGVNAGKATIKNELDDLKSQTNGDIMMQQN